MLKLSLKNAVKIKYIFSAHLPLQIIGTLSNENVDVPDVTTGSPMFLS